MIVLPNSTERYLSALRIYVSLSVLKHGLQARHLKMLKKIYTAEAYLNRNSFLSVDIYKLSTNLFRAAKAIAPNFNFKVAHSSNRYINKAIFTLFLLKISLLSSKCEISFTKESIVVKSDISPGPLSAFLSAMGGYSLYEIHRNRSLLIIPAPKTDKPSVYIESEWELIFDKFSLVNIFFTNIFQ